MTYSHSEVTIQKIAEASRQRWTNATYKRRVSASVSKGWTVESRTSKSKKMRVLWNQLKDNNLDESRLRGLRQYHKSRFARTSLLELRAGMILLPRGFKHRGTLPLSNHPFDYINFTTRTVVEVNGCYWHHHVCRYCTDREDCIREHMDNKWKAHAQLWGFKYITLWQCEERQWLSKLKVDPHAS